MTGMVSTLVAGPPLEPARQAVGRTSSVLIDSSRADRVVPVDAWYPALSAAGERSRFELLPGVGFTAAAGHEVAVAAGPHPLVLWSHGRSGTRCSYALLCEAIAARGFVVVAPEHGGDALADWLLGTFVDDDTNERNRVADARFVLDTVFDAYGPLRSVGVSVDRDRVAVAGHSYGGFTALSLVGATAPDERVRAVAGLQSFTRSIPKRILERIEVPTLLVTGSKDVTTPPVTDADRAWATLGSRSLGASTSSGPATRVAATSAFTSSSHRRSVNSPTWYTNTSIRWRRTSPERPGIRGATRSPCTYGPWARFSTVRSGSTPTRPAANSTRCRCLRACMSPVAGRFRTEGAATHGSGPVRTADRRVRLRRWRSR